MSTLGSSGLDVFPLALGINAFGRTASPEASHAILDAFVARGGNFIDAADAYPFWVPGDSGGEEAIVGSKCALVVRTAMTTCAFVWLGVAHRHPYDTLISSSLIGIAFAALGKLIVQAVRSPCSHDTWL